VPTLAFWKDGNDYAFAVTHDAETRKGLEELGLILRSVEEGLRIKSSWYIPSHKYNINPEILKDLVQKNILAGHDTTHDGKLVLQKRNDMLHRLTLCRETINNISNSQIIGFRAPLLQHSTHLLESIKEAGFLYDSSCPTWEPVSCVNGGVHGVRTVFPINVNGLIEVPITLPQDHQMLYVLKKSPKKCFEYWLEYSKWIKRIGGLVLLLVHPEYSFSKEVYLSLYKRFLRTFTMDRKCWVTTSDELALWWKARCESSVNQEYGKYNLEVSDLLDNQRSLQVKLFTAYDDSDGFHYLPHTMNYTFQTRT
jgi:peptidoglycan/xylan/chitin deacetylase (PgdA/CDA1 family)